MEDEDRTTLLENLEAENDKLRRRIEEMGRIVEIKENLQSDCTEKDLQMKELKNLMENIKNENEVVKKELNQKNELVSELEKEVGELKAERTELESECAERDFQMKEHGKLMENLRNENKAEKDKLVAEKAEVHKADNKNEHKKKSLVMAGLFA
ncbi:uncharacterized protein PF3D7_1120000-like [Palaemon carinicauda]|uniref:uncharacterized protein PF3D7_1120000-like n=1 Tax=Palaemon carinicauda TaxID=392227 RepID=UPI0035B58F5A